VSILEICCNQNVIDLEMGNARAAKRNVFEFNYKLLSLPVVPLYVSVIMLVAILRFVHQLTTSTSTSLMLVNVHLLASKIKI